MHSRTLIVVVIMIMLLAAFPIFAQNSKNRAKPLAASATESAGQTATAIDAEPAGAPSGEQGIVPPPKPGSGPSGKGAGVVPAKPNAAVAQKSTAAAPESPAASEPAPSGAVATNSAIPASAKVNVPESLNQAGTRTEDPIIPVPGSGWAELIKTVGSVGLIICLILTGYILFRKYGPQYLAKKPGERNLRLLETLPMGDKRSLVMVQAGSQRFLLASTPGQISLLTALPASGAVFPSTDVEPAELPAAGVYSSNFRNLYEQGKRMQPIRPAPAKVLPPDIRGKMQELRKALEG